MALGEIGPELVLRVQASLQEIEATMEGLVQSFSSGTLPVPRLAETFRRAAARIATFINVRSGASAEDQPEPDRVATSASPVGATVGGVLRTREDARRSIQDVIRFVEKIEPGHPAPLLLKRADRLLGMSFVDIIRDMAPNALSDIERIVGSVAE
jgi:type VI secretion system protein ImpA